jgi:hypothetical protein
MNSSFIPEQQKEASNVPYFDDVTSEGGWKGQTTTKSLDTLKNEIVLSVSRLGGLVISFQRGKFEELHREGFRLRYNIENLDGTVMPGRIDIAALPVRPTPSSTYNRRVEQALKMSLFMLRDAFDGLWFLQQLSPGYAALMPFMLNGNNQKTITEMWSETASLHALLPPSDSEFVDGLVTEVIHG